MPKPRILICEDEENLRKGVRYMLERDYELTLAADGEEGLNALSTQSFDLVILDIKLPKVDGLDLLKALQAKPNPPPVIMLTAYQSTEVAQRATLAGANEYVTKPFVREDLVKAVERALRRSTSPQPPMVGERP